jgi:hypothetical protein
MVGNSVQQQVDFSCTTATMGRLQVADYMRQLVETSGPTTASLPGSRVEHIQCTTSSSGHPVPHILATCATALPQSTTANKSFIADTADAQLHANESLHSLALQHAGILQPPAAADSSGALRRLCNGAVCASLAPGESLVHESRTDMVGARSRAPMAGSRPQTVLAELSTRLMMESKERSSFADPDSTHPHLGRRPACEGWLPGNFKYCRAFGLAASALAWDASQLEGAVVCVSDFVQTVVLGKSGLLLWQRMVPVSSFTL